MVESIYSLLNVIGFTHPLHPALTHIPIGLIIGALVFRALSVALEKPVLTRTARHCLILALATLPLVALLGIIDWQHFYKGAWIFQIKVKTGLAAALLALLSLVILFDSERYEARWKCLSGYLICGILAITLGFFGGELVYGTQKAQTAGARLVALAEKGASIFETNCAKCHYTDKTENKVGPGLKGLFSRNQLPLSGRAVSDANIRNQLKAPVEEMPPFPHLTEDEIQALIAYLKTL